VRLRGIPRRPPATLALCAPLAALTLATCGDAGTPIPPATARLTCPEVVDTTQCAAGARFRIHVRLELDAEDGQVEVVTQSGPYHLPAGDLDGKTFLYLFMPKGEVFQGDLRQAITIGAGVMHGTIGELTTEPLFAAGEYEFVVFIDVVPGPMPLTGPERGDLAAFDNSVCDPTGVSVRIAVPCGDGDATISNRQFIIF